MRTLPPFSAQELRQRFGAKGASSTNLVGEEALPRLAFIIRFSLPYS